MFGIFLGGSSGWFLSVSEEGLSSTLGELSPVFSVACLDLGESHLLLCHLISMCQACLSTHCCCYQFVPFFPVVLNHVRAVCGTCIPFDWVIRRQESTGKRLGENCILITDSDNGKGRARGHSS